MALFSFLCGVTLMIILASHGCHSVQQPACGKWPEGKGHLPWLVVLTIDDKVRCFATLINDQQLLTVGHCKLGPGHQTVASLGRISDMSDPVNNCEESRTVVNGSCNMPSSNSLITKDSMCILTMSGPVNFTDFISPVCLASGDSTYPTGLVSYVVTGSRPVPLVQVLVVGYNECKCTRPRLNSNMVCAGHTEASENRERCEASLGGPLMVNHKGSWVLIGIVRFDQDCPSVKSLRAYLNVAPCQEFVRNNTIGNPPGIVRLQSNEVDLDTSFECRSGGHPAPPKPTRPPKCPHTTPQDCSKDIGSVFDSGVNAMSTSPFILLCVLVLTVYGIN
ncbi:chymotrypsin-like protease CTRL-1 [Notolabrus celidotus]|uniref:chymotrypsin-like protease CTRL-1 n=1 Tax=Notolabrus celidotus TaxID=1203425 RepID=UPI00148F68A0|nr:chymotrypsin-like protease CTRL-1 [Notolabrus celidotus]